MAARFHCAKVRKVRELRKSEAAWLIAVVIVNGIVALTLQDGFRYWLSTPVLPEPRLSGKPVPSPWICAAWGPFAEAGATDELIARIEAMGGETELIAGRLRARPDYLLLVGPQGSFEAARRVREELGSQSIDSHIVPRGPFARALEVGVFADPMQAMARQARVEELGYMVDLKKLQRAAAAFHLVARLERISAPELPPAADCGVIAPGHRFL